MRSSHHTSTADRACQIFFSEVLRQYACEDKYELASRLTQDDLVRIQQRLDHIVTTAQTDSEHLSQTVRECVRSVRSEVQKRTFDPRLEKVAADTINHAIEHALQTYKLECATRALGIDTDLWKELETALSEQHYVRVLEALKNGEALDALYDWLYHTTLSDMRAVYEKRVENWLDERSGDDTVQASEEGEDADAWNIEARESDQPHVVVGCEFWNIRNPDPQTVLLTEVPTEEIWADTAADLLVMKCVAEISHYLHMAYAINWRPWDYGANLEERIEIAACAKNPMSWHAMIVREADRIREDIDDFNDSLDSMPMRSIEELVGRLIH